MWSGSHSESHPSFGFVVQLLIQYGSHELLAVVKVPKVPVGVVIAAEVVDRMTVVAGGLDAAADVVGEVETRPDVIAAVVVVTAGLDAAGVLTARLVGATDWVPPVVTVTGSDVTGPEDLAAEVGVSAGLDAAGVLTTLLVGTAAEWVPPVVTVTGSDVTGPDDLAAEVGVTTGEEAAGELATEPVEPGTDTVTPGVVAADEAPPPVLPVVGDTDAVTGLLVEAATALLPPAVVTGIELTATDETATGEENGGTLLPADRLVVTATAETEAVTGTVPWVVDTTLGAVVADTLRQ
jgi:hypothetical protein